ncbi:MAG: 16S rRNA (cytidine(1402)-2'-O)-methyltransferase [Pseudanabaenaceae cyanobacterium SKYGB_i_bin29]|nr:16S rRNA (cytidine(1402)-2'-O)-methyltransferase [Pseudanabaenaceae cyanobacterium SKYG29]MDW8420545.1 16S rRNA (cytidine(1402)-2'-O)-methyltransferase [Pseudanabaenaceae cyanobacterium SKYGB_i_bin29]
MEVRPQTLYIVGTPIGNLADMTLRAIEVLQKVDLIAAEDTRHTAILLQHFQIATPQISFHSYNSQARLPELLAKLQHHSLALVTDAGMPTISDPGLTLVRACVQAGFRVVPIPGVTAGVTALVGSGLDTDRFVFEGFLPLEQHLRQARIEALCTETRTVILYEAPHRLVTTLADLVRILGETRPLVVARELTKQFEEFYRGTLGSALAHFQQFPPKGEFTLVLGGVAPQTVWTTSQIMAELQQLIAQGMSRSAASRHLAELTKISKRQIYQWSLQIEDKS